MSKNKRLRAIADKLPPLSKMKNGEVMTTLFKSNVSGIELLKSDITEVEGNPVDGKKMYTRTQQVPVLHDHFHTMNSIYRNNGADGVNEYINLCYQFHELSNPGISF